MDKKNINHNHSPDFDSMDQWLRDYFLDPKTEHDDHTLFKIDIYETDDHWIVEAVLKDYVSSEIKVRIEDTDLLITAQKHASLTSPFPKKERTIQFPFKIIHHCVTAFFQNGILEIFLSKTQNGLGKNRYITLP
ncbi:Hsp20/alpha crystallin family protein [Neobacillus mesonae]|uniref:Hsp20/alpha crystallin family protein n=1 Tax=Neobacillus mesonae TaxID=1193713 RepID=UPI002572243D|nr:Hsp20/alpha crystallin family protein [Neobacillus mesonae]